jgi:hypothetical protein
LKHDDYLYYGDAFSASLPRRLRGVDRRAPALRGPVSGAVCSIVALGTVPDDSSEVTGADTVLTDLLGFLERTLVEKC